MSTTPTLHFRILANQRGWFVAGYATNEDDMRIEVERIKSGGFADDDVSVSLSVNGGDYEPWQEESK